MKLDTVIFYTNSINHITSFYKDSIGLQLEAQQGEMYVSFIFENGVSLGIKKTNDPREIVGSQTIIVEVNNIKDLSSQLKEKNIPFYKELQKASWGTTFSILDPDKNKVEFVERP